MPNAAQRNADIQPARSDGSPGPETVAALDLHYLITFYGDDAQLQPQRLGSARYAPSTLDRVADARRDPGRDQRSHIQQRGWAVRPRANNSTVKDAMNLSLEELSKVWSVFFSGAVCLIGGATTPRSY
jgi:hypothetical protein